MNAVVPQSSPQRSRLPRAAREQQILDIAHAHFAEHGYGALTMDEVAAAAGVTKPLLYAYFGNKERLYLACMERAGAGLMSAVAEAVAAADGPSDTLRRGLAAFFAFVDGDRDAWRVLYDETLPAGGEIARRVGDYRDQLVGVVTQSLVNRIPPRHRARHAVEVEGLSHALMAAAEGLARWWLRTGKLTAAEAAELLIVTAEPGLDALARGDRRKGSR